MEKAKKIPAAPKSTRLSKNASDGNGRMVTTRKAMKKKAGAKTLNWVIINQQQKSLDFSDGDGTAMLVAAPVMKKPNKEDLALKSTGLNNGDGTTALVAAPLVL
jgi:hypothetical protein